MRLSVVVKENDEVFAKAAKKPACPITDYPAYYEKILTEAEADRLPVLDLQGIGKQDPPSRNFQYMGAVEKILVNFLRDHEYPKQIRIITQDEEELTAYMVVYNFWYAEDKASRLNNGRWD